MNKDRKGYGRKNQKSKRRNEALAGRRGDKNPPPPAQGPANRAARYSRPPLARMVRLHEEMTGNRYPNCRKIGEEFEVSAKTVQRDINFMRDRMGLPIEYDKARFGFHYTRPVSGFPSASIQPVAKSGFGYLKKSPPPPIGERPSLPAAGGADTPVRIRFDAESARLVRSRTWHPTQFIHSLPDGSVEMTLRARDEAQIARWVLSWGAQAWVLEPLRLRTRLREIARQILARH